MWWPPVDGGWAGECCATCVTFFFARSAVASRAPRVARSSSDDARAESQQAAITPRGTVFDYIGVRATKVNAHTQKCPPAPEDTAPARLQPAVRGAPAWRWRHTPTPGSKNGLPARMHAFDRPEPVLPAPTEAHGGCPACTTQAHALSQRQHRSANGSFPRPRCRRRVPCIGPVGTQRAGYRLLCSAPSI